MPSAKPSGIKGLTSLSDKENNQALDKGESARLFSASAHTNAVLSSRLAVDGFDEGSCIEELISWLNDDCEQLVRCPKAQESRTALISAVTNVANMISIARCNATELSAMRSPWGDRACPVEPVAAWCTSDRSFGWRFENWRAELQTSNWQGENIIICSTILPRDDMLGSHWPVLGRSKVNTYSEKYLLVCRFSLDHQVTAGSSVDSSSQEGQCYAIACPPSVLPLRFATVVPTLGQPPWRLECKQVLPLPG